VKGRILEKMKTMPELMDVTQGEFWRRWRQHLRLRMLHYNCWKHLEAPQDVTSTTHIITKNTMTRRVCQLNQKSRAQKKVSPVQETFMEMEQ
jgi:hypothetical protein